MSVGNYGWPHLQNLAKSELRGKILYSFLEKYISCGDRVLDVGCGYAPLGKLLIEKGCKIFGFDVFSESIEYLRKEFPLGHWEVKSFKGIDCNDFDIILFLGLTGAIYKTGTSAYEYWEFLRKLFLQSSPKLIMIESSIGLGTIGEINRALIFLPAKGAWQVVVNDTISFILSQGYRVLKQGRYDSQIINEASEKLYNIFGK